MKKNNIICRLFVISIVFLGIGCTNLDETLYDKISAEDTQLKAEDLTNIMAPAYASFRTVYWGWNGLFDLYEESSDLIVTPFRIGIGWGDLYITMHKHTWGPDLGHAEGNWYYLYTAVNECNRALYQVENLDGLEASVQKSSVQELKALRAIYYYLLYDNFRNIPIVTDFVTPVGFLPTQSTSQETYNFIENELLTALPSLSEDNNSKTYGRVTKWAAKMTLAKLYLNSGVYLNTPKWDKALEQVNDIISSNKFELTANYSDSFKIKNEGSSEEILSIPYDEKYAGGSYYPFKTLHPASQATFNMAGSPWGGSAAIPQFIDTYDVDDVRLKDTWLGGLQYDSSGNPLMFNNIQLNYTNYMSEVDGTVYNEGYRCIKYEIGSGTASSLSNDVPFYRLTDALMIKAECLLRMGDVAGAATIVSQVRARSFKTNPIKATVTGAKLLGGSVYKYGEYSYGNITKFEGGADILYGGFLDELAWEFVGEHHRKQDLIRFGVYTTKSWFSHKPNGDYRKIFPIPQSIMETNSKLKQNTGYGS